MKTVLKVFTTFTMITVLTLFAGQQVQAICIEIGQESPAFTLNDIDGNSVSLSDYKGKVVLIDEAGAPRGPRGRPLHHITRQSSMSAHSSTCRSKIVHHAMNGLKIQNLRRRWGRFLPVRERLRWFAGTAATGWRSRMSGINIISA